MTDADASKNYAPPTEPAAPPQPTAPLSHFATDHLVRMRREMTLIPGDATTLAHIVAFVRSLISRELADPARQERDKQAAEKLAAEAKQKAVDDLKAKHEAEVAALPEDHPDQDKLAEKHATEQAELDRQHRIQELDREQADERDAFMKHQAEQRAAALARVDEPAVRDPRRPDPNDPQFVRPPV